MELIGNGLNKGSYMYFYTPSQMAKRLLYYPVAAGDFFCNSSYKVERTSYNSILAIYVLEGELILEQKDLEIRAESGELLFIDCFKPHKYYAAVFAHTLWVHFDGSSSQNWFHELCPQKEQKVKYCKIAAECIKNILRYIKAGQNEYALSNEIYTLLCAAAGAEDLTHNIDMEQIAAAKDYIREYFSQNISVSDIAAKLHISTSYFSKVFKEATAFSPYEYILNIRLEKAKELLLKTVLPVSEIACQTGFQSTSNFIYFFHKETGLSPLKFRKMEF